MGRLLALALVVILTAGCASSSSTSGSGQTTPSASAATTPAPGNAGGTTIMTASSDFGDILFDATGQAIYIWQVEGSSKPECYDDCARAWPPVLTTAAPVAAGQVNASLLATTSRTDGTLQVTYAGHPLYFYANEGKNEVKCHNVRTHGGFWWVVTPAGKKAD